MLAEFASNLFRGSYGFTMHFCESTKHVSGTTFDCVSPIGRLLEIKENSTGNNQSDDADSHRSKPVVGVLRADSDGNQRNAGNHKCGLDGGISITDVLYETNCNNACFRFLTPSASKSRSWVRRMQ